jgi:NADH-quinone oxidoreductase subunit F/NADP-reducing hydrogenase subunit HndC
MFKTSEQLLNKIAECRKAFDAKNDPKALKKSINICGGTGCMSAHSEEIKNKFEQLIKEAGVENRVSVNFVGCFGFCSQGPFVKVLPTNTLYRLVKPEDVYKIFEKDILGNEIVTELLYVDPNTKQAVIKQDEIEFYKKQVRIALNGCGTLNPEDINESLAFEAYAGLAKALTMNRADLIQEVIDSGLRGRGGGGFPTGTKWKFAYAQDKEQKYVVCNADEGDPGAFMDRSIMEGNPHAVLEGMAIAAYAIGANEGYIYVRAEYPLAIKRLEIAIKDAEENGLLGDNILGSNFSFRVFLRYGAGAFVCGEETALLQSIEGKRGMPVTRPPFPAVKGLWGQPTIINNVETMATVPYVLRKGAKHFSSIGTEDSKGTKVFALGGKVNNVGLVEVPMGTTLRELIYDIGGGIPDGKKFKAIQTGGPSGGCLTEEDLDSPIDYKTLIAKGSMMGSGGAIVMDEDNCMVDVAKFYLEFICDESCGKCSPCRIGTTRMLEILTKITNGNGEMKDLEELEELAKYIQDASLCGLGQTAPNPVLSTLRKFKDEYVEHILEKKCRAKVCKNLFEYKIDAEKCKKCGMCARQCPANAITGVLGKEVFKIDPAKCVKCGACVGTCRFKAIYKG